MPGRALQILQPDLRGMSVDVTHVDRAGKRLIALALNPHEGMTRQTTTAKAGIDITQEKVSGGHVLFHRPEVGPERIHKERRRGRENYRGVLLEELGPVLLSNPATDPVRILGFVPADDQYQAAAAVPAVGSGGLGIRPPATGHRRIFSTLA